MTSIVRWLQSIRVRLAVRSTIRRLRRLQQLHGLVVMGTALAGKNGSVKIGANTVAELDEWTYTPATDLINKEAFLSTSKSHIAGLNDGTGSFKGRHDMTDTNGQLALRNAQLAGTQVTLLLYVDATHKYTVPALIKAHPIKAAVNGAVEIQFDFQADGDVTYA